MEKSNIFAEIPTGSADEIFEIIFANPSLRIERIISTGQSTPPGEWYDQSRDEWVMLLQGSAELLIEGQAVPFEMKSGDYILLPAHKRHRVERTDSDVPTIWLAVHFAKVEGGG